MTLPAPLSHLVDALGGQLDAATARLASGHLTPAQWHDAALKHIGDATRAAYVVGTAERLGTQAGSALINARNLSRAERAEIAAHLTTQAGFLGRLTDAVEAGALSSAETRARLHRYAGSVKSTYWQARTSADLPFYPGDGCECGPNCQCRWEQRGEQWYWVLGHVQTQHCDTCRQRADGSPY